jgi:hypothetical protein
MTRMMITGVAVVGTVAGTAIPKVTRRRRGVAGKNVAVLAAAIATTIAAVTMRAAL